MHYEWRLLAQALQGRFASDPDVMACMESSSRLLQCAAIYDYFKLDQGSTLMLTLTLILTSNSIKGASSNRDAPIAPRGLSAFPPLFKPGM